MGRKLFYVFSQIFESDPGKVFDSVASMQFAFRREEQMAERGSYLFSIKISKNNRMVLIYINICIYLYMKCISQF